MGRDLTVKEAREAFNIVGDFDKEGYFFTALTMGLMAKGPTVEELLGFCFDRKDRIGSIKVDTNPARIIDISGGGGDKIKTINVSTAASFVLAAGGVTVAKQCAAAFTGFTGSSDILKTLGIKVPTDKVRRDTLKKSLETTGLAFYNYAALAPKRFINFLHWRRKMIQIDLKYMLPHHIASFAYSPIQMENRLYGVASTTYMSLLANLLKKLGFKRVMVVCGTDGLDELSNVGKTEVLEIRKGKMQRYNLLPEDLGVRTAKIRDIQTFSREQNVKDFINVLAGKDQGAKRDLVAINAGAGFYLTGKVKTLKEGTKLALDILKSRKTLQKMEELVSFQKSIYLK